VAEPTGLAEEQRRALDRLSTSAASTGFYLAGGTAVAMHCGHRRSLDLGLFSLAPDADLDAAERWITKVFERCEVITRSDAALQLVCDGARIDLVRYPYAPLEAPELREGGILLARLRDLGTMKLAAIARRGLRRDFWDLFAILEIGGQDLAALTRDYVTKFGVRENDLYHVAKALTFFDDAERDPALPAGMTPALWASIKDFFRRQAPRLVRPD
jgi:hypothetical protein